MTEHSGKYLHLCHTVMYVKEMPHIVVKLLPKK